MSDKLEDAQFQITKAGLVFLMQECFKDERQIVGELSNCNDFDDLEDVLIEHRCYIFEQLGGMTDIEDKVEELDSKIDYNT